MYQCEECGKEFETTNQLRGHMMSHAPKKAKERTDRVPLGTPHRKLQIPEGSIPPGKVPRWVNDTGGRLTQAQRGGYEFVYDDINVGEGSENLNSDLGSYVSQVVGKNDDGSPIRAFLMTIDKDLYDEDQAAKNSQIDKVDESIRRGANQNTLGPHGYVTEHGRGIQYDTPGETP